MKHLDDAPITKTHLEDYLKDASDFAFEMKVLKILTGHGIKAEHGGAYVDRVTGKSRQFDIRATITTKVDFIKHPLEIRLAIECKNVGDNFPLLVNCVSRMSNESYHDVVATLYTGVELLTHSLHNSAYSPGGRTGKSLAQVGRDKQGGFVATDSDVYERWSQALASASDLFTSKGGVAPRFTIVIPVVVVPDGRLWAVDYDDDGSQMDPPQAVDNVPYYVGEKYEWVYDDHKLPCRASHLEFVTLGGLNMLLNKLLSEKTITFYFNEIMIGDLAKVRKL